MLTTNLKRAALTLFLATAGILPANAQVTVQLQLKGDTKLQAAPQKKPLSPAPSAKTRPSDEKSRPSAERSSPSSAKNLATLMRSSSAPSPYWIGVEGQSLDAAMRAALELTEKHGILVARVSENSPAAKAGLQAGDVLLQWCDAEKKCQPIEGVEQLAKLVQESGAKQPDKAITLEIRRRGKNKTIELKPTKRAVANRNIVLQTDNKAAGGQSLHQQSAMQQQLKMLEKQRAEIKAKIESLEKQSTAGKSSKEVQANLAQSAMQQRLKMLEKQRDETKAKIESLEKQTTAGKSSKEVQANLAKAKAQIFQLDAQIKQATVQLKQFETWSKEMSERGFSIPNRNGTNLDVLIPGPGMVTKSNWPLQDNAKTMKPAPWPEDLKVTMTRTGNKPAEFTIQRGQKKWQVTSDKLSELPPDIRAFVEPLAEPQKSRMLRLFQTTGDEVPGRVELRDPEKSPQIQVLPSNPPRVVIHATPQSLNQPAAPAATQKQIQDLQRAIESLRRQVEQMDKK